LGAQGKAASGPPFLWILSFGGAKESIAPAGARTGIKYSLALAKHQSSLDSTRVQNSEPHPDLAP